MRFLAMSALFLGLSSSAFAAVPDCLGPAPGITGAYVAILNSSEDDSIRDDLASLGLSFSYVARSRIMIIERARLSVVTPEERARILAGLNALEPRFASIECERTVHATTN